MNDSQLDEMLQSTFSDRKFTRTERDAVRDVVADFEDARINVLRAKAFDMVRGHLERRSDIEALEWLEELVKALNPSNAPAAGAIESSAHFSPGADCLEAILAQVRSARASLDVCVFTITDDRISGALAAAHQRGIKVRIISDDDKAHDLGSDVHLLAKGGVPVATDATEDHMHHKFAIIDGRTLLNGSFNWTRSATVGNLENLTLTTDPSMVKAFGAEFDKLWNELPRLKL